jgi:prefoldin subunit 5
MQQNTQRRAAGLKDKIPDIQKTLETVRFLRSRQDDAEPLETTFELNDTLFAKAEVPPTDEVYLWLGANVMLAYPIPEAEELLRSKLSTAKHSLTTCEEDLDFLREQITVRVPSDGGPVKHTLTLFADSRGRIRTSLQLGRCTAEERERGWRVNTGQEGRFAEWMKRRWHCRQDMHTARWARPEGAYAARDITRPNAIKTETPQPLSTMCTRTNQLHTERACGRPSCESS